MRLLTFGPPHGEQVGVVGHRGQILPLARVLRDFAIRPGDVNAVLGAWPVLRDSVQRLVDDDAAGLAPDSVRTGPPVPQPGKIVVVGANYSSFLSETTRFPAVPPSRPLLLLRPPSSVSGPRDVVVRPPEVRQLDYEGELAVVIGRGGGDIPVDRAPQHVMGYMNANDIGACDVMRGDAPAEPRYAQPTRGKAYDTFCPTGPYLLTGDEVSDPAALHVRTWVNGELRQEASVADLVIDVPRLVSDISSVMRLHPGDIILTGTPGGCGADLAPPVFLQPGDVLRQEVTGLGALEVEIATHRKSDRHDT